MPRLLFAALLMLCSPALTLACSVPPPGVAVPIRDLVARTGTIVLVHVAGPHPASRADLGGSRRHFGPNLPVPQLDVVEVLKGRAGAQIVLPMGGYVTRDRIARHTDFDAHRNPLVWSRKLARTWNTPACTMEPVFREGDIYLVFMGKPHWRGYEQIVRPDDLWLNAVRRMIADPTVQYGLEVARPDWLDMHDMAFFATVESCVGPTYRITEPLKGDPPRLLRPPPDSLAMTKVEGKPQQQKYHGNGLPCVAGQTIFALGYAKGTYYGDNRRVDAFVVAGDRVDLATGRRDTDDLLVTGPEVMTKSQVRRAFD